ncbi:hypothetical protein CW731_01290 [Polaribacter sp. ALD11]|uniref:carboxypeptidase-like regulatory domain-containing protein n=1 Tax=Polaribacter sp. ALD11 TaxID=2058137 RepID=UPI000C319716|nr:carboxypeptidase-like regulatory domain-containing protein [Polaribacter sp. ALD11]AUC84007.1 hypothetical protein CW731_01290 [Polaribacter sp. ALD11]
MHLKLHLIFLFFFGSFAIYAQKTTGKIFSKNLNQPIEKVAIATNIRTGTISNKLGEFKLDLKNVETITFSFLGYETKTFSVHDLKNLGFTVYLSETVNQLNEIELKIAKISLESLISKTIDSMKKNYISRAVKQNFYVFEKQKMAFQKLALDLKSSSLLNRKNRKLAQNELQSFSNYLKVNSPEFTKEFVGVISSKEILNKKIGKTFKLNKIDTVIGYKKNDIGKGITINNIQDKLQNIILKHLRNDKTYKIKTGLFKVEDSLSFKELSKKNDSIQKDNSYGEFRVTSNKRAAEVKGLFFKNEDEHNFLNGTYYHQKLEKNEIIKGQKMYVVSFKPRKSKSKFSGKVYINPYDFTVKKLIYKYAKGKRGEHVNLKWLLGIKYSENENSTILLYKKNEIGKVYASYFKQTIKNYAYINRPIKFIENSKEKEKVKFNIKVEVIMNEITEVLLNNTTYILKESITTNKKEDFSRRKQYISKETYLASHWKNRKLIDIYLK